MIRSETMQAKQWTALGKTSYNWVLDPGSVFLPREGDSGVVGLRQRCEEQRGSTGLSTEGLSKQWRHAGHFLAVLPAVHLLSLSPGTLVHNPSSASWGHCDWLLDECIGHLEKNCLLPQSVAISWLFGSCPSDCSSSLHGSEILCTSWQCSQQHHLFFVLYSMPMQKSWCCLQVPISSLTKNISPTITCLSVCSSWMPATCSPSEWRLFCQVAWGLWVFGLGSYVGRVGWSCTTTKKPERCVSSFILF